jgi:hypothetical protein
MLLLALSVAPARAGWVIPSPSPNHSGFKRQPIGLGRFESGRGGQGAASKPLPPSQEEGVMTARSDKSSTSGAQVPTDAMDRYLREHYSASRGGLALFQRSAGSQSDPLVRRALEDLTAEVAEDRAALLAILTDLGVRRSPSKEGLAAMGERVGRLKTNGTLLRRSRLSDLLELEALAAALHAKKLGWLCLRQLCHADERLNPYQLDELVGRAESQQERVEALRLATATEVLSPGGHDGERS